MSQPWLDRTVRGVPRGDARWLLAGYLGLSGFFALEACFRRPGTASSLKSSEDDRGTTRSIVVAYGLAADLPLMTRWLPGGRLPSAAGPLGLVMQVGGLTVRAWSMRALGASYTRTLRTDHDGPSLIDSGPYRSLRHPGYLGSLLTWIGFALTSRSAPVVALTSGLLGAVYVRRISAEEQLLRRSLPGYRAYSRRTKRLIPFVW